jgi:hypothetical protein
MAALQGRYELPMMTKEPHSCLCNFIHRSYFFRHQRTCRPRNPTSVLPLKADSSQTSRHVRVVLPPSDSCTAAKRLLLDHLVGAGGGVWAVTVFDHDAPKLTPTSSGSRTNGRRICRPRSQRRPAGDFRCLQRPCRERRGFPAAGALPALHGPFLPHVFRHVPSTGVRDVSHVRLERPSSNWPLSLSGGSARDWG